MRIRIRRRNGEIMGHLNDSPTAQAIYAALPMEVTAHTWGDERYFALPVETTRDPNATDVVEPGAICYWVEGKCLALPFGPTPLSHELECRLAAPVNVVGKVEGNPDALRGLGDGEPVTVERC